MLRDINDYVVAQDITNHLQVKHGDAVTISAAAFKQLKREKHFWTTVVIGGTATALTFGAATGFVGLGVVGSEIGIGLTAAEIAAVGGAVGGTASAIGAHAYAHNVPQHLMLETVPFLGKVLRKDTKLFSELYHVEVEWYIPSPEGGYTTQVQWVDAHHLVKLRTKAEDKVLATKAAADQKVRQDAYDAQLKERHRKEFGQETISLRDELTEVGEALVTLRAQLAEERNVCSKHKRAHWAFALVPLLLLL